MVLESVLKKLAVGQLISYTDFQDSTFEGELLSFDIPYKLIVLKFPSTNGKISNCDIKLVNLQYTKDCKIVEDPKHDEQPLQNINLSKLTSRVRSNSEAKMKQAEHIGIGVTPLAQRLLNSISKIITEIHWQGDMIVVMDEVKIKPPYYSVNCSGPDGNQALHLVKNLRTKGCPPMPEDMKKPVTNHSIANVFEYKSECIRLNNPYKTAGPNPSLVWKTYPV